jgi:hypothetical protein
MTDTTSLSRSLGMPEREYDWIQSTELLLRSHFQVDDGMDSTLENSTPEIKPVHKLDPMSFSGRKMKAQGKRIPDVGVRQIHMNEGREGEESSNGAAMEDTEVWGQQDLEGMICGGGH